MASVFVKTFNRCPICDLGFADHHFTLLSVVPQYKVEAVTDLVDKVKNRQMDGREIREFEQSQEYYDAGP
jgi:hypothetical protein